jgi:ribosomal protein S4
MISQKKNNYKLMYKKLLRLKVNPLNNNKFLKLQIESEIPKTIRKKVAGQVIETTIILRRFKETAKLKKEKWSTFLRFLTKTTKFFQKYKPYTFNHYSSCKFTSQGNSFKKKFKNELLAKKTFNYFYGGLLRKYLKKQMSNIYLSNQTKNSRNLSIEFFESRLDSVLVRARFCPTIKDAKQLIAHRHIKVNNQIEQNYSYILEQGDLIQINTKSIKLIKTRLNNQFKERFDFVFWPTVPSYLNVNYKTFDIIFGNIKNFNFSTSFNFKNDNDLVVSSYYHH